jgi:hypothetical protein
MTHEPTPVEAYEPPVLRDLGPVAELTQSSCSKWFGSGDGFFFNIIGQEVCVSR